MLAPIEPFIRMFANLPSSNSIFHTFCEICLAFSRRHKRKSVRDDENFNDFHVDLKPQPPNNRTPKISLKHQNSSSPRLKNGVVVREAHDNIGLNDLSIPTNKNYFHHGLESEAIKEALEDLTDHPRGGSGGGGGGGIKLRDRPTYPMRAISAKSRISVGPVLMEDDDASTQSLYDKVYTHNTFKHGK